jgi:hypothetical protein
MSEETENRVDADWARALDTIGEGMIALLADKCQKGLIEAALKSAYLQGRFDGSVRAADVRTQRKAGDPL